jgi:hypothetical protein
MRIFFVNLAAASLWLCRSWSPNYLVLVKLPNSSESLLSYATRISNVAAAILVIIKRLWKHSEWNHSESGLWLY